MYLLCILIKLCKLFKLNQWIFQSNFENNHSKGRLKCKQIGCPYFLIWTPNFICVLVRKRIVLNLYSTSILPTSCKAFEIFHPAFKALYFYFTDIVSDHTAADVDAGKNLEGIVDSNNKCSYTYDESGRKWKSLNIFGKKQFC